MIQRKLATGLVAAIIGIVSTASLTAQTQSQPQDRDLPQQQDQPQDRQPGQQPSSTTQRAKDAHFVQMMTRHHEQGIEMARLQEDQGSASSVKRLASEIRRNEERGLTELKRLSRTPAGSTDMRDDTDLDSTTDDRQSTTGSQGSTTDRQGSTTDRPGQPTTDRPGQPTTGDRPGSTTETQGQSTRNRLDQSMTTMQRQNQAMLDRLKSLTGEELDRAFLEEMAEHLRMGIHMTQLANLQDPTLDRLAQRMLEEHRRGLEQIEQQQSSMSSKR